MNILQSLLYGLLSGLAEFLPVSAGAHQGILAKLFGLNSVHPLCTFFIHIACLAAVFISCSPMISRLQREFFLSVRPARGRKSRDRRTAFDVRLLRIAVFPMLLGILLYGFTVKLANNLFVLLFSFFCTFWTNAIKSQLVTINSIIHQF